MDHLTQINLFTGFNNAGKAAILEALWLHSSPNVPDLALRLSRFRGIQTLDATRLCNDLFNDFDIGNPITLTGHGDWSNQKRELSISVRLLDQTSFEFPGANGASVSQQQAGVPSDRSQEFVWKYIDESGKSHESWAHVGERIQNADGSFTTPKVDYKEARLPKGPTNVIFSARYREDPNVDCNVMCDLIRRGQMNELISCLQKIDDKIQGLQILSTPALMIYVETGAKELMPIGMLGNGMNRFLSLALAFYRARNGILLIDEVENGLHHSVLQGVWDNLLYLSNTFNVQVFATTHSDECLQAAHQAETKASHRRLSVHRLDKYLDRHTSTTYKNERLNFAVEHGTDMR